MKEKYDVIIIGSGIAGMTAGIYLKRGGLNPLIIEENAPGGQLNKINIIENGNAIQIYSKERMLIELVRNKSKLCQSIEY